MVFTEDKPLYLSYCFDTGCGQNMTSKTKPICAACSAHDIGFYTQYLAFRLDRQNIAKPILLRERSVCSGDPS